MDANTVLDPDKYYIALVRSHYTLPGNKGESDTRHDQAIWTRPMRAGSCSASNAQRTTARDILMFIAGFDEDLRSPRIDGLELYELPVGPLYAMQTRDETGKLLI